MEKLNILDQKILHILQNFPLEPFSSLAQKLNISPQTMIRKVSSLKERGILKGVISSFIPEKLSLVRYGVLLPISQLHQFSLLENALSRHNYIRSFNRYYGEEFGIYAIFDFPKNQESYLKKFFEYFLEREFCDSYKIYKSSGYRYFKPAATPEYTSEPQAFDIVKFWQRRLESETTLPRLESSLKLNSLEPLHLKLLQDLTTTFKNGKIIDARTKQTDLIEHYRGLYNSLAKKVKLKEHEEHLFYNLSNLFDGKNSYNIKVEFGRKYYNVIRNLLSNPRWNIQRKVIEQNVTRAFFIENIPEIEKARFYRFLTEEHPPFQTGFELFNNGIFLRMTLPPYYDSKINYLIWSTFKNYKIYSLDFFGKHGLWWPFQPQNFDWEKKDWRTDDYWLWDEIINNLEDKLKNGTFGDVSINKHANGNNKGAYKNGVTKETYLYKHISNGSTSVVS
ncbi:MAG: Lrp/AsnC family transcriptional regulator [Candidatus Heimdallarchaeaceae archaeon]